MAEHVEITQDEMVATLRERFGDDPMRWAFKCPHCGDIATGKHFREALAANPRTRRDGTRLTASDVLGQECIGRLTGALDKRRGELYEGRGCDWAAYGLFHIGITVVTADGRKLRAFPIAPAPSRG